MMDKCSMHPRAYTSLKSNLQSYENIDDISIDVVLELGKNKLNITFSIKGKLDEYIFPEKLKIQRANELWRASCFELFLANDDEAYYELNFSPSLAWNFYVLDSYRGEPKELEFEEEPEISYTYKNDELHIVFELESKVLDFENFKYYNLATILLTKEKERTFWAIEHLSDVPDFHNKESFLDIT